MTTETRLTPMRPSAAIEMAMRRDLIRLLDAMQVSLDHWLTAAWNAKPPELAADALDPKYRGSPSIVMQRVMARLAKRWQKKFDAMAPDLARYFTKKIADRSDAVLRTALKRGGFTVEMKLSPAVNDVLQASMAQQVLLIKDLGRRHLSEISEMVQRSVAQGGDLSTLREELQARYGITKRRAVLISRDQNAKATATISRARREQLGITQAVWKHSHAGKVPRPTHVKMDGETYDIQKGMWDSDVGKYILPGTEINCRCFDIPVIPKLAAERRAA